jgi:DNA-binding response OmpR family regulator
MSQALVLSVGSDPEVLDARELILRSAGYLVVSARSIEEAVHCFHEGDFDLTVLCHSLLLKESERLTCLIRASGSRIPIVSVSGSLLAVRNAFVDATLNKDPVTFLESIKGILRKQTQMHLIDASDSRNDFDVALARKPPRSSAQFKQRNTEGREQAAALSPLGRTKVHGSAC